MDFGAASVLITGDLEAEAIASLLARYQGTKLLDADLYVTGHHGSKNGTTQALLSAVTPTLAMILMGPADRQRSWTAWDYGHPNRGVIDQLQNAISRKRERPIDVVVGQGKRKFAAAKISKAIYASGWDGTIVFTATSQGDWSVGSESPAPSTLVDINSASETVLASLPAIGKARAQAIVAFRTAHGPFASVDDLMKVSRIGPATMTVVRPLATAVIPGQ